MDTKYAERLKNKVQTFDLQSSCRLIPFFGGSAGFSSSFSRDRDELRVISSWLLCDDARLAARACDSS